MKYKLLIITIYILLISFLAFGAFKIRKNNDKKEAINNDEIVVNEIAGVSDYGQYPALLNIAPVNAYLGNEYRFDAMLVDSDSPASSLKIDITEGPEWLYINKFTLYGTPDALGSYKVVLKISDELHSVFVTYYILVSENV